MKIKNVMFVQFAPSTFYGGSPRNVVYNDGLLHVKTEEGEAYYGNGVISRMVPCDIEPAPAAPRRRGRPPKSKEVTDES